MWRLARSLDDHAMRCQRQCSRQQQRGIIIVTYQRAKDTHFLLDQRTLVPMREHRIKVDDLWWLTGPFPDNFYGIAEPQIHALNNRPDLLIQPRAPHAISQ